MEPLKTERGFTLIEVLIAAMVGMIVLGALTFTTMHFVHATMDVFDRNQQHSSVATLIERWDTEADSAWAVYTPASDVKGASNGDGHELAFFTETAAREPEFWGYYWDKSAHTLQRYVWAPGVSAVADGPPITNVTNFVSTSGSVDQIANPASPFYNPLFSVSAADNADVTFAQYGSDVIGGNHLTHVAIATTDDVENVVLTSGTAPSHITVVVHYTPSPTPAPGALTTWPTYVVYAGNGNSFISYRYDNTRTLASVINWMLGGGVAEAFPSPCVAKAVLFNWTTPDSSQQAIAEGVDPATGCYDGHVTVSQPNYTGAFVLTNPCQSSLSPQAITPNANGPGPDSQAWLAGNPTDACQLSYSGGGGATLTTGHGIINAAVATGIAVQRSGHVLNCSPNKSDIEYCSNLDITASFPKVWTLNSNCAWRAHFLFVGPTGMGWADGFEYVPILPVPHTAAQWTAALQSAIEQIEQLYSIDTDPAVGETDNVVPSNVSGCPP